jgi:AraC-like DNA-binding protein
VDPQNSPRLLGHGPHSHDVPELVYVVAGRARLEVDGAQVPLAARDAVWLAPGTVHAIRYESGGMAFGALLSPGTRPRGPMQFLAPMPELDRLMITILGAAPSGEEQIRPFRSALDSLLAALGGEHFALRPPRHPAARRVAGSLATSEATMQELSRREGISLRQLQRLFLEETGVTAATWRRRARLNVALRSLHGGSSTVVAAHRARYSSGASLLRALSRETGIPQPRLAEDLWGALREAPSERRAHGLRMP